MKFPKYVLILITVCLVWLAITYGSHLPDMEIRTPANEPSVKGLQVIGVRCLFLFLAFVSALFLLDIDTLSGNEDESR